MEIPAPLRLGTLLVASAVGITACSAREDRPAGTVDDGPSDSGTAELYYGKSPIVFGAFDPPGSFFVTLERQKAERINENYPILTSPLSPLRKRIALVTDGQSGEPTSIVAVRDIAPAAPLIGSFPVPGTMLGWAGEDTLLFATIAGLTRVRVDGSDHHMPFPNWVKRQPNGILGSSLSPDGKSAAFLTWTEGQPAAPDGFALFVTNTETGAVADIWAIPPDQWPGRVIWARDGHIVYYSFAKPALITAVPGAPSMSAPVPLPFKACEAGPWVTAGTLHMRERSVDVGHGYCGGSWLVDTDGSNPRMRNAEAPIAISPDGRKILLSTLEGALTIAEPDGTEQTSIAGAPTAAYGAVWW